MRRWDVLRGVFVDVHIHSACRTATGAFGGLLRPLGLVDLAAAACREAVSRAEVDPVRVDQFVLGNVLGAGAGPDPARQAALGAGLPARLSGCTIGRSSGSGLMAILLGAQAIRSGDAEVVLAGGSESPSNAPYLLPAARWGKRLGATTILDSVLTDGDAWGTASSGMDGPPDVQQEGLSGPPHPESAWAEESRTRARAALGEGRFVREIVPLKVLRNGGQALVEADEYLALAASRDATRVLHSPRNAGPPAGICSSPLGDCAAVLLLGARGRLDRPLARLVGHAAGHSNQEGLGLVVAIRELLSRTGLSIQDIDCWEIDEATASLNLAIQRELPEIDPAAVNRRGGTLALGHPLGATGARMLVSLLHILEDEDRRLGVVAAGAGGGHGMAVLLERM